MEIIESTRDNRSAFWFQMSSVFRHPHCQVKSVVAGTPASISIHALCHKELHTHRLKLENSTV